MPASSESGLRCIAIAGPTASGKTAAAMAVAGMYGAEIISVDSALVYRGMDIGTAKPTPAERAAVPHHLIDIRDPLHAYSAVEFAADAHRLVGEINARGKLAVLAGGTMLYFKALFEGLDEMPPADAAVRAELAAEAALHGWPAMHAALDRVDSATAARLAPGDTQRIQRALEVWRISGRPLSAFHGGTPAQRRVRPLRPLLFVSLEPADRGWLHARIAQRFEQMLDAGLLEEVRSLRSRGGLAPGLPSMRCVGYRQAWELLDEQAAGGGEFSMPRLRDKGIFATRQLAKRQLTWLRGMPSRTMIACDAPDATAQVLAHVEQVR